MAVRPSGSVVSSVGVASMSSVMEELVAGARATRDSTVNTLDAVDRQSKAVRAEIAKTVVEVRASSRANGVGVSAQPAEERDTRFDPEEWDRTRSPGSGAAPAPDRAAPRRQGRDDNNNDDHDDDNDNYPETWLR